MSGAPRLTLEEFKARLPLLDIVARHVRLVRKGREWQGLCPFHKEKSPSFSVVEEKGFFHCFGCGANGSAIDFVMRVENLDFVDALQRLEELTGIPAPRREGPATPAVDQDLYAVNAAAAEWFAAQLAGVQGREARAYLAGRDLRKAQVERFGLGFAPSSGRALVDALTARGMSLAKIAEAGLVLIDEERGRAPFDRFRNRLMFPIRDERGRVVGFGGRAFGDVKPKYLNTSETPLFHKGELLYGLDLALAPARTARRTVVVEGYIDVIAMHEAGLPFAVAPLGTALSERQLQRLWKLSPEPVLCFDGDEAGKRAADRAAERALPFLSPERSLRVAFLPPGKDPDDLLRSEGRDAVHRVVDSAVPLVDFLWSVAIEGRPIDTPERRAALRRDAVERIRRIVDPELQRQYVTEFRRRLDVLMPFRSPGRKQQATFAQVPGSNLRPFDDRERLELALLAPLLREPRLLRSLEEDVASFDWQIPAHQRLVGHILEWYARSLEEERSAELDADALTHHLARSGLGEFVDRILGDRSSGRYQRQASSDELVLEQWARLRGKSELRARARAAFSAWVEPDGDVGE
ncbi:MAG TPA: DNA primase [Geminicoccus sp.]|uniref:DNA primase n=1 Tax=Geminicoccus sp. TaxID=2024832 RepID=UPI002E2EB194|nr:DNA primase [Geminicoccus sp.]HEX2527832.1 DNA primase [Geminicoccus sp.]